MNSDDIRKFVVRLEATGVGVLARRKDPNFRGSRVTYQAVSWDEAIAVLLRCGYHLVDADDDPVETHERPLKLL